MCSPHETPLINSPGCTIDERMQGRFLSPSPCVGPHGTGAACRTQRLRPALCLPSVLEHWCKTQLKGESQLWHRVPGEKHMLLQGKFLSQVGSLISVVCLQHQRQWKGHLPAPLEASADPSPPRLCLRLICPQRIKIQAWDMIGAVLTLPLPGPVATACIHIRRGEVSGETW